FIQHFDGPIDDLVAPIEYTLADTESGQAFGLTTLPHLRDFSITGPFVVTGVSDTPSRRRIFTRRPTAAHAEPAGAAGIIQLVASGAYRGPAGTTDVDPLMRFYEEGRRHGDFESGIQLAVQAILASPRFVFRFEDEPAGVRPGQNYRLSDGELASR